MNSDTDLVQFRLGIGGQIEYRQRLPVECTTLKAAGQEPVHWWTFTDWTEWEQITAIKGDESDRQFE